VLHVGAHWRHLANTTEPSVCGGDAAFLLNYFYHFFLLMTEAAATRNINFYHSVVAHSTVENFLQVVGLYRINIFSVRYMLSPVRLSSVCRLSVCRLSVCRLSVCRL